LNADRRSTVSVDRAESTTGIKQQQVSTWRKRLQNEDDYRQALYGAAYRKAMAEEHNHRAQGTGENEWYTPIEFVEAARSVLGEIDLDPATSEQAQEKIKARKFFTLADDGLKQEWNGRVWLNPPFAQPHIADFVSKMVAERRAERVTAAIMLTHNYTDTAWFHEGAGCADAICFTRGRVKFYDAKGNIAAPTQGQAFFYLGHDVTYFAEAFRNVGFIVEPRR
jgi:ParB family chromosome partitioning protein